MCHHRLPATGHLASARWLHDAGVSAQQRNLRGEVRSRDDVAHKDWLSQPLRCNLRGETLCHVAARRGELETLRWLVEEVWPRVAAAAAVAAESFVLGLSLAY